VERQARPSESGQAQSEYVLVVAGIALACIAAALLLGALVVDRFDSSSKPLVPSSSPFTPPRSPATVYPTSLSQCEDGGWRDFPQFADESACADYIATLG
jgi:Flp pilus assembly pilin Flp